MHLAPDRALAVDDQRRPMLLGELRRPHAAERQLAVLDARGFGKELEPVASIGNPNAGAASYLDQGDTRGEAAFTSPRPLLGEVFSFQRTFCDDTEIRTPRDRGEVAARLGGRAGLQRPESRAGRADRGEALVPARDAAVPVRPEPPHGPRPELHDGRSPDPCAPPQRLA